MSDLKVRFSLFREPGEAGEWRGGLSAPSSCWNLGCEQAELLTFLHTDNMNTGLTAVEYSSDSHQRTLKLCWCHYAILAFVHGQAGWKDWRGTTLNLDLENFGRSGEDSTFGASTTWATGPRVTLKLQFGTTRQPHSAEDPSWKVTPASQPASQPWNKSGKLLLHTGAWPRSITLTLHFLTRFQLNKDSPRLLCCLVTFLNDRRGSGSVHVSVYLQIISLVDGRHSCCVSCGDVSLTSSSSSSTSFSFSFSSSSFFGPSQL